MVQQELTSVSRILQHRCFAHSATSTFLDSPFSCCCELWPPSLTIGFLFCALWCFLCAHPISCCFLHFDTLSVKGLIYVFCRSAFCFLFSHSSMWSSLLPSFYLYCRYSDCGISKGGYFTIESLSVLCLPVCWIVWWGFYQGKPLCLRVTRQQQSKLPTLVQSASVYWMRMVNCV